MPAGCKSATPRRNLLRVSEAVGGDTGDLRRDGHQWCLKGSDDQVPVQVPEPAVRALRLYLRSRRGPLFLDQAGKRMSRQAAADRIRSMGVAAGIDGKRISPHSLRHTATSSHSAPGCSYATSPP